MTAEKDATQTSPTMTPHRNLTREKQDERQHLYRKHCPLRDMSRRSGWLSWFPAFFSPAVSSFTQNDASIVRNTRNGRQPHTPRILILRLTLEQFRNCHSGTEKILEDFRSTHVDHGHLCRRSRPKRSPTQAGAQTLLQQIGRMTVCASELQLR